MLRWLRANRLVENRPGDMLLYQQFRLYRVYTHQDSTRIHVRIVYYGKDGVH